MKKIVKIIILSFIFIFSCKEKQKDKIINNQKNNIIKKDTLQEFVQKVINDKRMNIYLDYLTDDDKSKIVLIEDQKLGITKEMKIHKFNHYLQIIPYDSIKDNKNGNFFYITKIDYFKDSLYISYYYKLENLECQTYFKKNNKIWKQGDTRILRY